MATGNRKHNGRQDARALPDSTGAIRDWVALGEMIRQAAHLATAADLVDQARACVPQRTAAGSNRGRSL